jgi:hypothetical protein
LVPFWTFPAVVIPCHLNWKGYDPSYLVIIYHSVVIASLLLKCDNFIALLSIQGSTT